LNTDVRVDPMYQRRAPHKTSKTASLHKNRPAPEFVEGGGSDPPLQGMRLTLDGWSVTLR